MKTGYPPEAFPPIVNIRCIKLEGKLSVRKNPQLRNTRIKNFKPMKHIFTESQLSHGFTRVLFFLKFNHLRSNSSRCFVNLCTKLLRHNSDILQLWINYFGPSLAQPNTEAEFQNKNILVLVSLSTF